MIFPIPGCVPMKPGSATLPFFGIEPVILNEDGKELIGAKKGFLAFKVCVKTINILNTISELQTLINLKHKYSRKF